MRALVLLCVVLASVSASAQSAPDVGPLRPAVGAPEERRAVAHLLSAIHELPPRADFEQAAVNPWPIVASIAAGRGPIAERAVEALFLWPSDATFQIAGAQLGDSKTSRGRRHRLLLLVAEAYGDRATPLVTPYLVSSDAQLRITAGAAVAKIRSEEAFAALDAAIAAERDEAVARELRRYARRILR